MTIELIEEAIIKADLTREEAASLFRVTRNTLYRWLQGKPIRNKMMEEFAVYTAKRILNAVAQKKLPLSGGRVDKLGDIKKILLTIK